MKPTQGDRPTSLVEANDPLLRQTPELAYVAEQSKEPINPIGVIGTTGLRHAAGFVDEEFLARLRGQQGVRYYRQMMDNNSVLGAIMFIIKALVRQVPWKFTPADDTAEALRWAEFSEEVLSDMSHTFEDLISEVLSFLGYGWSYFELIYKLRKGESDDATLRSDFDDGLFGFRKMEIRSQDTLWQWGFDRDGGLRGMVQLDTWNALGRGPVFLPIEKSLLFRTETTKGNPEGKSLLRPAVRSYHMLTRIEEIEAVGIDRDLTGMPIFEVPKEILMPSAGTDERKLRALLETMIQQVRVDERFGGLVPAESNPDGTPSGFKFKLMSTGGRRMIDTNEIIKRYESRIAMCFLAEFMMIGTEKVGTQSLYNGKSNLFGIALGMYLDIVAATLNRYAFARLYKLNKVPRDLWPELGHGDVVSPDLEKLGAFVQALGSAGILSPNRKLESKLLEMGNLPAPEDEELAIFEDETKPTPATSADLATGLLSERQVDAILKVNEAIAAKKMSVPAATKLLAATLGMSPEAAAAYLEQPPEPADPPATSIPPKFGAQPAPGVAVNGSGQDQQGEQEGE